MRRCLSKSQQYHSLKATKEDYPTSVITVLRIRCQYGGQNSQSASRLNFGILTSPFIREAPWCPADAVVDGVSSMHDRAEKPFVIAALGTSLTARGMWLEMLPQLLEPLLDRQVQILNLGRAGASSRSGISIATDIGAPPPDVLTIEFAINDAALHRSMSLAESVANIATIVHHVRAAGPDITIYLMTMNPARGVRGLLRPRLGRYYDLYTSIAEREQTGLIDIHSPWRTLSRNELKRALPDGLHPTPEATRTYVLPHIVGRLVDDLRSASRRHRALEPQ